MAETLQWQDVRTQRLGVSSRWLLPRLLCLAALLLLICSAAAAAAPGSAHTRICHADQFQCRDGSCILQAKMCDGRGDCTDNTDELDCDYKMCRQPHWFQCAQPHGACLAAELKCNGIINCPGGEDELDCAGSRLRSFGRRNCSGSYEWACQTDGSCIPLDFRCNGKRDCRDGSDELAGCQEAELSCKGFMCANRRCLQRKQWQCDGVDDCGDGSDERGCANLCKPELGKFLCHNQVNCIDLKLVCNGQSDCIDGSDESTTCHAQPDCSIKKCAKGAACQMLPSSGAECFCPPGFRLAKFQNVCEDVDECLERYDTCSQHCENTSGGYRCSCDAGYALAANNRSCKATADKEESEEEEPLLLYTTQVAVMGVHLHKQRIFTIAGNLTKVIGVAFDGAHIYWTNIQNEAESIVRANSDGSMAEILLTSGLDAPEDLAVDWLTQNIYFSDNIMRHIAVCSSDALSCVVLVTQDVHQPRGLALWPQRGQMFWTDWGSKPMIARASMDGAHSLPIVVDNIHWPNGIALDMQQERVYWVDAKLGNVECVRTDGSDRRTVLDGMLMHPYGLAVFEDQLYWSDWGTKSVHACNKFSGKDHRIVASDRTIYAVHVYHSSKQPKSSSHACVSARCSHLCLLAEHDSFSCACPDGMQLSADQRRCSKTHKKQRLYVGLRSDLLEIEHTAFGRHRVSASHTLPYLISQLAYNNVNGSIFIADNVQRIIVEYDPAKRHLQTLAHGDLGNVTGLAFDHLAHNLYWSDSERHVIEVISMLSGRRAVVRFFAGLEAPIGLAVMPADGFLYVALRARRHQHIDQLALSGRGQQVHVFEDDVGDDDICFATDHETHTLFWSDSESGRISFSDYRSVHAYPFRGKLKRPFSLALVDQDLFWTELGSPTIYWTHKSNMGPKKRVEIEAAKDVLWSHSLPSRIPLTASVSASTEQHPCQRGNGGCSHVCVSDVHYLSACLCPSGFVYKDASNRTCIEALDCEFRCRSGECLTLAHRCNGRKDCPDSSDEANCEAAMASGQHRPKLMCAMGEWACHDGEQCISKEQRCDGRKDCHDKSDEQHCSQFDKEKKCHVHQHLCDNGKCVDYSVMCDGTNDCGDNSDESHCKRTLDSTSSAVGSNGSVTRLPCGRGLFQCNSGSCIASGWECDGKIDCSDASDEHDKCGTKECPPQMHRCLLGQCLDAQLVCDGHNDCGDQSDELNCDLATGHRRPTMVANFSCADDKFQCKSKPEMCLEMAAKCNGTAECPRGEDEADCGEVCGLYEFQCVTNKQCIRLEFRCDREKDCADGSDELNCDHVTKYNSSLSQSQPWATAERPCKPHMFDCKDGECVEMSRVCNKFPDCNSGIDEGPQCASACQSGGGGRPVCAHKCRPTPTGAVCSCFPGYRLDSDLRNCVDLDECIEQEPCAQLCENTMGSYSCQCYPDFMLRQDRVSCKSIESQGATLLFTSYNEVRNMSEQPISLSVAWSSNDTRITGFDLDLRRQLGYFSSEDADVLYMVDLQKEGKLKAGLAVRAPSKVAVDWVANNVYVVSRTRPQQRISVCSFTAKMCGRIVEVAPRLTIKALALDAYHRRLFYVSIKSESFGQPLSQLSVARLDGGKREQLVRRPSSYITALATDPHKQLLYFVDLHTKTLEVISYKPRGSRRTRVLLQKGASNAVLHPSGLSVYENHAYMVNIGAKEAVRCQLYGQRSCKAFNLNILNAEDILVAGRSRQPLAEVNPCVHAKCDGMCLQADYGYECMCGDDVVAEAARCPPGSSNEISASALIGNGRNTSQMDDDEAKTSAGMSMWLLGALLLLALMGVFGGYFYYRRQQRGHRDLNINLHFQNPLATLGSKSMGGASSRSSSSSGNGSGTTAASFTAERSTAEPLQFGMSSIQRFLRVRQPPQTVDMGTEMLLETQRAEELHALDEGRTRNVPNVLVGDTGDDAATRHYGGGYAGDDAHARLVP